MYIDDIGFQQVYALISSQYYLKVHAISLNTQTTDKEGNWRR